MAQMKHKKIWIVVADSARAQFFLNNGVGTGLEPALPLALVADNRPSRHITSDRSGRTFDSSGPGRHAMQPPSDPHRHEQTIFAREIAKLLEQKREKKAFNQLVIIAAPKMLGDLRLAFSEEIRRLVVAEINKDLTKLPVHELKPHLDDLIRL